MRNTYIEHKKYAKGLFEKCTAHMITFGGRCLNCGFDPNPEITKRVNKVEKELAMLRLKLPNR